MAIVLDAETARYRSTHEDYAWLFGGMPLAVLEQEDRLYWKSPIYLNRAQIPPNLKTLNYFRGEPAWVRNQLQPEAYMLTRRSLFWLYDISQIDAIRARHPLRREYSPRKGYRLVTKTELRKMGFRNKAIAVMRPVVEVKSGYQGWIYMFEVLDR